MLNFIRDKFQQEGVEGKLLKAQDNGSEKNQDRFKRELVDLMADDANFANQLKTLIEEIKSDAKANTIFFKGMNIKGNAQLGNVALESQGGSMEAITDSEIGGDFTMGDVTMTNIRKKALGEEHPNVTQSLNNLALLYQAQGKYAEAEPLYLQALELNKKLLGIEHPYVAKNLNNLAALYRSQGRYTEAEPFYLQALELNKKLLGAEHPNVAKSLNNLAVFYDSQGGYAAAELLYLQAITIAEKVLGENHSSPNLYRKNYELFKKNIKNKQS